ncbi:MAG: type II secretion system protein GspM [Hydrogenovibrio sp.]|uniref:type II secretion system protein GspM n=1 Tax=Hydrogenovibrio sp. TaxID=2065821 RepID=UPI0028704528|nr:type II secretion system protein GspM [Hydrogenovibrio sp.]MDR9499543.1 type II secretion system protein GspM [Hydrogenovibrio sp.]
MWNSINVLTSKYKDIWFKLEARERHALQLMGLVLLLSSLYFLVWQPLEHKRLQAHQQLSWQEEQYQWLSEKLKGYERSRPGSMPSLSIDSQAALVGWVQERFKARGIQSFVSKTRPLRATATQPKGVRFSFESVPAQQLYQAMAEMERQGLAPTAFKLEPLSSEGLIAAQIDYRLA